MDVESEVAARAAIGSVETPQSRAKAFIGRSPIYADAREPFAARASSRTVARCKPLTVPDPSVLRSQRDNRSRQRIFIGPDDGGVSLRPAWLANDPAGMTSRETVLLPDALDCLEAPRVCRTMLGRDLDQWFSSA